MPSTRVSLIFDVTLPIQSEEGMVRRTNLLKVFILLLCVVTLLVLVAINKQPEEKANRRFRQQYVLKEPVLQKVDTFRIFHLDLKGAPPKMSYLLSILPLVRTAGANGLLIEYEDMFPWSGTLRNVSAGNAYTVEEIKSLLKAANALHMEVIPLVQTFGHLEFILKLEEFRHLRELDSFPQEICPSKDESFRLIKEMIRQVMEMHGAVKYIHIGCDEVYHISACSLCSRRNPRIVFTTHVKKIGEHIKYSFPGVTPIIWDDMMRRWSPVDIEESGLGAVVEPMVWVYIDDIPRLVPHFIWYIYKKTFRKIWGASAFKGAFGETEIIPDISRHVDNTLAWLRLMSATENDNTVMEKRDFMGLVLTGWSRYDHFAVLAELLPIALPSLLLNLALVHSHNLGLSNKNAEIAALDKLFSSLNCSKQLPFSNIEEMRSDKFQWSFASCNYLGSQLYLDIQDYFSLQTRYQFVMNQKNLNGWVSDYNIRNNFSSPFRLIELFPEEGFAAQRLLKDIVEFRHKMSKHLQQFYDLYTVNEWLSQKLDPMQITLKQMEKTFQLLVERKTWPRRPLVSTGT